MRGLEGLKAGGVLLYSTCSLNPVENELVIMKALIIVNYEHHNKYTCIDLSRNLDAYKIFYSEGKSGRVLYDIIRKYSETFEVDILKKFGFCELADFVGSSLSYRLWPHQNDAGGFFLAAIQRSLPDGDDDAPINHGTGIKAGSSLSHNNRYRDIENNPRNDKLYKFVKRNDKNELIRLSECAKESREFLEWKSISSFYSINLSIDKIGIEKNIKGNFSRFFVASESVLNIGCDAVLPHYSGSQIFCCGITLFKRMDDDFMSSCLCRWKPVKEGLEYLIERDAMQNRIIYIKNTQIMNRLIESSEKHRIPLNDSKQGFESDDIYGVESCNQALGFVAIIGTSSISSLKIPIVVPGLITMKGLEGYARKNEI